MMVRFIFNLDSFVILCWLRGRNSIKMINDLWLHHCNLHGGMWSFVKYLSATEVLHFIERDCHTHYSPWISARSIQCEVVCQYVIPTYSLPLSAGDYNHSKYLVGVNDILSGMCLPFSNWFSWSNGMLHKRCCL